MMLLQYKLSKLKWCDLTNLANTPNEDFYFCYFNVLGRENHLLIGHCCREMGTSKSICILDRFGNASIMLYIYMYEYTNIPAWLCTMYVKKFTHASNALYIYT